MKRDFDTLARETFDLIVVGGGIIGAGIARDAALRGLRTLLVEKEDFAYGTTSRSTRLIHGGLRYLRRLELGLVRQDLRERQVLLSIAPHLVHPLPFLIPLTRSWFRLALACGLQLYDLLSFDKSLPSHHHLSRRETLEFEPSLELQGLVGSYLYYDCQVPFAERLCLENALAAAEQGASLLNHTKVTGLLRAGSAVGGVQGEDLLTGASYQLRGRLVVNAAGPWADGVRDLLGRKAKPLVRLTKGVHLLTPQVSRHALVLFARSDGRLFFVTPWQEYSLIGTTDTDYSGDQDRVQAEAEDVNYLLTEVRRAFPGARQEPIFYTTAGLRALVGAEGAKAGDLSRDHKVVDHEAKDGVGGFISVLGGKITAYRAIAQEVVDLACQKLGLKAACSTAEVPLPGAPTVPKEKVTQAAVESGLSVDTVAHLAALYGSCFTQVLRLAGRDARGRRPLCPHSRDILAQVWHAVEEESALTVSDFLRRRSAIGLSPGQGLEAAETVAQEMRRLLGWSAVEQQRQVETYRNWAALSQRFRAGSPVTAKL